MRCSFIKDANACISACLVSYSIKVVRNLVHSSPLIEAEDSGIRHICVKKVVQTLELNSELSLGKG